MIVFYLYTIVRNLVQKNHYYEKMCALNALKFCERMNSVNASFESCENDSS